MSLRDKIRKDLRGRAELWRSGLHGFERETFRLNANSARASATTHKELFDLQRQAQQIASFRGSPAEKARLVELLPHALTLDFSDQQPELVSPPHGSIAAAAQDIELLLRFIAGELKQHDEMLWAFSQPPLFCPEDLDAVRVASFAGSEDAAHKELYRKQLLLRYGSAKQSWTGIHYNFSLDQRLFSETSLTPCDTYVHLGRNLWRNFWLLELIYGCVPSISPFYAAEIQQHFQRGGVSVGQVPPHASSLHAHFAYGYRSSEQQMQYLEYSESCLYWQSIEKIRSIDSNFFRRLGLGNYRLIQDSRELYTPFRLKQLHAHGDEIWDKEGCLIDYLELRILDIDPLFEEARFTPENAGPSHLSGIYLPAVYLSHLLFVHSAVCDSPMLDAKELLRCAEREQYIISQGRNPKLPANICLETQILLEELGELAALFSFPEQYSQTVAAALERLQQKQFCAVDIVERFGTEPRSEDLYQHSKQWTKALEDYAR